MRLIKCFSGLLAGIVLFAGAAGAAETGDKIGQQLHSFSFADPQGQQRSLADYRGEVVVVKLWATWCGVCRAKWPAYQAMYDEVKDLEGVRFVTLSVFEELATSQSWAEAQGYDVPLYGNNISDKGAVSVAGDGEYFIKGTPMMFLLDKDGIIRDATLGNQGEISVEEIKALLG